MHPEFIHLRLHTDFSLVDGIVRIKSLLKRLKELNMPAVAVTDEMNLFAMVKIQKAAMAAGIKPIFGTDVWLTDEREASNNPTDQKIYRATLLIQNLVGYRNLTELISAGYLKGQATRRALIDKSWVKAHHEGLILLSGAREGDIGQALLNNNKRLAEQHLMEWSELFGDRFYLEIQRTGRENEEAYLNRAVDLALKHEVALVATNDVRFLVEDDFEAHEVRTCISSGNILDDQRRVKSYSSQQFLRSTAEMQACFSDLPEALENTLEIAKRCSLEIPLGTNYLPNYEVPEGLTIDEFFRQVSHEGLKTRLEKSNINSESPQYPEYIERLDEELDIIIQMGFPGYFLIVMDFIHWAKQNGVPVGPGRGSGAGSLVAYVLDITDLDPIAYDLLFERFLNPERVSMPDFDIDFCMEGRDRVIDYVAEKYGRDAVSQIITYGTMAAKAVVRDVGRVLGKGYGFVDRIAKLIPFEIGMTLTKALEQEDQLKTLYDDDTEIRDLLDMALKLEGLIRNVGKHAGGVVIAPGALTEFTPLYCDEEGNNLVTQFDKDDVEQAGLVKFDFLGLRTLTIVNWAVLDINERLEAKGEPLIDITDIDLGNTDTFNLLKAAETTAVFQLESRGMKDLIKRLQPSCFEDIVALVALFRPGPLQSGMVDDFINRKHGRAAVEYPHPDLEPILKNTYGVILYQEQVMQIAQVLAGYTLGGADMLRRAMGKKKPEEMAKQRILFTEGSLARGIAEDAATYIFDLMEKFAGYGFNKSHSAAYALVSYQTAWLKQQYPANFMAAVLSADMHNTDKVVILVDECKQMGIEVVAPSVNHSQYKFSVDDQNRIRYGLGAIKGLGEGPVESIVSGRAGDMVGDIVTGGESNEIQPYQDLFDFCRRIDLKKLNKRAFEALIKSGAADELGLLEELGEGRAVLWENLETALRGAQQAANNAALGMQDLLSVLEEDEGPVSVEWKPASPWTEKVRLSYEKETLGLFLTGHPIDEFKREIHHWTTSTISEVRPTDKGKTASIAGLVIALRTMRNKRGDRMAFATLDDQTSRIDISLFSDVYTKFRDSLKKDELVIVSGEISLDDFTGQYKMNVKALSQPEEIRAIKLKQVRIQLNTEHHNVQVVEELKQIMSAYKQGPCAVSAVVQVPGLSANYEFSNEWSIFPKDSLLKDLQELLGASAVSMSYN